MWMKTLLILCFVAGALCANKCSKKADIAFVIDSSSSIWPPNFDTQVHFLYDVLDAFDISPSKTQIAAVSYSDVIKPDFQFNSYKTKNDVLNAIQNIVFTKGSATRTYEALRYMNNKIFTSKNGARDDVIKIAIVMTDGETNPGSVDYISLEKARKRTLEEAKRARDNGIYVFAIGVGGRVMDEELYGIASEAGAVMKVPTYGEFKTDQLQEMLEKKTCEVGETTTLRPPAQAEQCYKHTADVIFAIDQSDSIGKKNFNIELDFVNDLVQSFNVASDETRIGALVFSTTATRFLELRDGVDKEYVKNTIHSVQWGRGSTFIGKAFKKMREGFSPAKGGRPSLVPQIAVLITDGQAFDHDTAEIETKALKQQGITIFVIGTMEAKKSQMVKYASSEDNVFYVNSPQALRGISDEVSTRMCKAQQS
ncbi:collagen alpha-6(VI) chain-like [Ostrea edulis]|uniref:collagen alpha-6(VI) chain-like n=1 Tax=Ostrea edulis TaxID=37623 RepID=UPI0024AECFA0|nr:collagen alpha-6(VI) chain-like [Ostrea edulis]